MRRENEHDANQYLAQTRLKPSKLPTVEKSGHAWLYAVLIVAIVAVIFKYF